jgi:putative PEP-CTERM system TPR-repeat lipoprotein
MLIGFGQRLAIACLLAMALGGCGTESPQALIDSAKEFAAKGDHKAAAIQLRNVLQKQPEYAEARYLLGQALNEELDYVSAEKELRKALEYGYAANDVFPALARAMLGQGRGKEVVAELKDKTLTAPEAEASLKTYVGLAYYRLGQSGEARRAFDAALKAKPGYNLARVGQAMLVAADGDIAGANKLVDEALASEPTLPEALTLKADLLLAQDNPAGAIKVIEQVVKVQPNNFQAHFALANLQISEGNFDAAAAGIAAMRTRFATSPRVAYLEAFLAFRRGDAAKTREAAQQVLKVIPDDLPSLFLAGAADYQLKSYDMAAERLRQVANRAPQNNQVQTLLTLAYLGAGKPEKAREAVEVALRNAPGDPKVLGLAGEVALANNDLANASQYYLRATKADKQDSRARMRLGQVRLASGDASRAVQDLDLASALDPGGYQPDLALVTALLARKELDKAMEAVIALEKKLPNDPATFNLKGIVYGGKHDLQNARVNFAKALELQSNYIPAARNLATLDIADRKPEAARGRFEAIIAKEPRNEEAIVGLADVLARTGAPPKDVVATLERAVAADPQSVSAKLALANYHLRIGDAKSALGILQGLAAANPNDSRILERLGFAQQAAGETNQAIATYSKLATLNPKAPEPLIRVAALHLGAKDYDAAIQALRKVSALKPDAIEARAEIVKVMLAAGKTDDALAEARAIEKEFPKDAVGFVLEGDVLAGQKKWEPAASAYREGLKRQRSPVALTRLHTVLQTQGKTAEANALVANWLRENPKDTVVRVYLADRASRAGNFREAAKLYKEVLPALPENALILNNLAWAAMETNDPGALGYAEKAYSLAPDNASVLDTYGWLLLRSGDAKRAIEILKAAVRLAPKSPVMRLHLAKAYIETKDNTAARNELEALLKLNADDPQRAEAETLLKAL